MKILAIRGENLASLAGCFDVDLERPPLGSVGLFAITGATGAGKSTLLDAMCVALFDKTPRLEKSGGVLVGRANDDPKARLPSNDVRSLLRRGVGAGFAEVDYLGRDGRRYRARWSLHRARESANGGFRRQEMTLIDLASDVSLGRTKTEVLEKIEETIGLSYDQFRRSALLAQGDFAAFLKANSDERASLLEQMTGTELYSEISIKAHLSYKEAHERLAVLMAASGAVQVLSPEGRAALEGEIAVLDAGRNAAATEKASIEAAVRWFGALTQLRAREAQACSEVEAARAAQQAQAPLREQLVQVETAVGLRPALVAAEGAEIAQTRAATLLDTRATEASMAIRRHGEAAAALEIAVAARTQALAGREGAQDALRDAARLDLLIEDGLARRDVLITTEQLTSRELDRANEDLADLNEKIDKAKGHVITLAAWIAEHASITPLVEAWSLCQPALNRYARAAIEWKTAAAGRHARVMAKNQAVEAHTLAENRVLGAKTALTIAEQAWRAADEDAQRVSVTPALHAEGERLVERLRRADKLAPIVAQVEKHRARMAFELGVAMTAWDESSAAVREAEGCDQEAALAHAAWSEAERALQLARATLDLADRRAELRDDEACPLCGSHDHPYAHEASPLGGLIADAEQRVHELSDRREGFRQRAATCRANAAGRDKAAEEASQRASEAASATAALEAQWKEEVTAFGVDADEPDGAGLAVVQAAIDAVEARRDAIRDAATQAAARATAARALQGEHDVCRAVHEEAVGDLDLAALGLSDADRSLSECDVGATQAERDRTRALEDIAMALETREDWRAKLDADPLVFAATCAAEVTAFRTKVTEHHDFGAALQGLRTDEAALSAMAAERVIATADRTKARVAADTDLAQLRSERVALLDGRPTEEVRRALDGKIKLADEKRDTAQAIEADLDRKATAAATESKAAAEGLKERVDDAERARSALSVALERIGVDLPTLRERLARPESWIDATRVMLVNLEETLASRVAVFGECARARATHEGNQAPSLTEDEARAGLAPAEEADKTTMEAFAAARERRRTDDAARQAVQGQAAELAARHHDAEHWQKIDDLIGSADGKRFRVFAQSLTLEALLSHANEHLNDFAPRYRLMRVPAQDLDLQIIDQDMGDEVRSVNSLSGGESFLVSLALALGLSSLAARDVRVETLFIDEGFGTLDPETLDVALGALDALQSSGRQIGLISHVSGLADQIGAQVHIQKLGGGRSQIVLEGTTAIDVGPPKKVRSRASARKKASSANEPTST